MMGANERYNETSKEIETKLAKVAELLEAHKNQCAIKHWGHTGDLIEVNQELGAMIEFLS